MIKKPGAEKIEPGSEPKGPAAGGFGQLSHIRAKMVALTKELVHGPFSSQGEGLGYSPHGPGQHVGGERISESWMLFSQILAGAQHGVGQVCLIPTYLVDGGSRVIFIAVQAGMDQALVQWARYFQTNSRSSP